MGKKFFIKNYLKRVHWPIATYSTLPSHRQLMDVFSIELQRLRAEEVGQAIENFISKTLAKRSGTSIIRTANETCR